ncbi:hypothetical protein ACFFGV_19685 [Pontibacillus salicampi]|uniref:Helix-turn-helix domain containing protein n=1 Tax=Pontibacillus salicampi TaxID=1449801 RepID=A0ABV6LTR3_9BACI
MSLYFALENVDLDWKPHELHRFREYWEQGYSIQQISRMLKRPQKDIAAIILDQSLEDQISVRYGGIFGNEWASKSFKKSS